MSIQEDQTCAGNSGMGPCTHTAKYIVSRRPACGVHLHQIVKLAIERDGKAVAAKA